MTPAPAGRALRRLAAGALAGVALAALSLLRAGDGARAPGPLDAAGDAVARVDGEPISREALARLTAEVARQRGVLELDATTRRELLDRLIDEELLLREGLALGLARRDPAARQAIVSAVVEGIGASGGSAEPDRAALEALYAETREHWRQPGMWHAEAALVPVPAGGGAAADAAGRRRAEALAARAAAGERLGELAAAEGVALRPPLPSAPLAVAALRARLATPAFAALAALAPGAVAAPVRSPEGWWVVQLVSRGPDEDPPLEALVPELRNLWLQREHERALRAHLDELRGRAELEIADD